MSDPRFDGSLDTPPALRKNVEKAHGGEFSQFVAAGNETHRAVETARVNVKPVTTVPVSAPISTPAIKPVKRKAKRKSEKGSFGPVGLNDESAELTYGTDLEILSTDKPAAKALKLSSKVLVDSGYTTEDDSETVLAGAVMLAGWKEPPVLLCPDDGSKVQQIRARLIRDGIALPTDGRTTLLRAAWLKSGLELSFGLDAMVAAGELRRTWCGNYYLGEPRELYEPWYDDSPRGALETLLGWMSGTTDDLVVQLAASGVPSSYYANVNQNLHWLKRKGLARQVKLLGCAFWTAVS